MTHSAYLIFNPVSGQGNPDSDLAAIRQLLEPEINLKIHVTTPESNPSQLAAEAVADGVEMLLASGGDGTVSAVAKAAIGTDIPLGIIPRGTANAFAVSLGIPNNIPGACQVILAGANRKVDAAFCNDVPLLLLAGIGFEAEVVEKADRVAKNRIGNLAYILAGFMQLREQDLFETQIDIEGVSGTLQAGAVTIANAAPPTSILAQGAGKVIADDGLLDITIATPNNWLQAIDAMSELLRSALVKRATNRNDIIYLRTKRIKVVTNPPQKVVVDGEIIGTTPLEVECIPGGLIVLAPPEVSGDERLSGYKTYLANTETELSEWQERIEQLQGKYQTIKGENKGELDKWIGELQVRQETVQAKLQELETVVGELEAARSDLIHALEIATWKINDDT